MERISHEGTFSIYFSSNMAMFDDESEIKDESIAVDQEENLTNVRRRL